MGNTVPVPSNQESRAQRASASSSRRSSSSNPSTSRGHYNSRHKRLVKLVPHYGNPGTPFNVCSLGENIKSNSKRNSQSEEEQIKLSQRLGFIQNLPQSVWENTQSFQQIRECCICMIDFEQNEDIRCLPCMHYYHVRCIDDWLVRSFLCPTCMQPVDAALLSTYSS